MEAPVFVKIGTYKEISGILTKIQGRLESANKMIDQLEKIKDEEEERIQEWRDSLHQVQGKLDTVNTALHQHK